MSDSYERDAFETVMADLHGRIETSKVMFSHPFHLKMLAALQKVIVKATAATQRAIDIEQQRRRRSDD